MAAARFITWIGVQRGKFYDWQKRYGKANEHNALVPRDHWLEPWEREAILAFHAKNPLEGYRRLTFMMLDANVVAASPKTVWRVLSQAGVLDRWNKRPSKKGTGFVQPLKLHEHWQIDISYLNISGTFYYQFTVLDGCSRAVIHWDLRESMTEQQVECILQRARELYPAASPRIISDKGPQFIAHAFKEFIKVTGMSSVRTSHYYPQSNSSRAAEDRALPQDDQG
jgi:putative transposase